MVCNFYPRPPRGGRQAAGGQAAGGAKISIHALREEGDRPAPAGRFKSIISIHALREEGDVIAVNLCNVTEVFLSTPSARRATVNTASSTRPSSISIHALREEGDRKQIVQYKDLDISIHALREEGDLSCSG